MINKIIILADLLLPLFAGLQLTRSLLISYIIETKLRTNEMKIQEAGLMYLLAEDKRLMQRLARVILLLLMIANFLLVSFSISRIVNDFAPYATNWIKFLSVIFHLCMALSAHFIFMIFSQSNLSFLKYRFKIW